MRAHVYPYESATPVLLQGVIEAKIATGTRKTKTKLYIADGNVGTLLGCRTSEILGLVGFAPQVYET